MATPYTLIGSAHMDLEQEFRMMTLELAQQLSLEECQKLAYVSSCTKEPVPPQCDYRLHIFSTLESRGKIGPLNLDFLENTLELIGRKDLLDVIMKYKKKPIYKEVHSKKKSRSKGRSKQKGKQMHLGVSFDDMSTLHQYEDTFSFFLIQFAQMTLSMRSALESKDVTHIKFAFSSAALEGDAVSRALRKKLSIRAGSNSDTSSRESSAPGSTPSPHFTNSSRSTPESSLNPIVPHAESQQPYQVSSPFPSNHTRFVFPSSSVSCNYEADYTGGTGGTGDSGVGDTFSNHIPSKEALRQIDPALNRRPDHVDNHCGDYPPGYTRLQFEEESRPQPNEYMMVKFDTKPKSKDSSNQ